jgi:23S rRNA (cytosine1962-C5)-methyltransferase
VSDACAIRGRAIVHDKGLKRLRQGHPWVYASDIDELPGKHPGIVEVAGRDGKVYGTAMYSPRSTITLRMVGKGREPFDAAAIRSRVVEARERRDRLLPGADAYRALHGEADRLPGLFVDRYGDVLVAQSTTASADLIQPLLIEALLEVYQPRALIVKNDARARKREDLPDDVRIVHGQAPIEAHYHEGTIGYVVDPLADQKTGSFLDQAVNHVHVGRYARGEALDCFTYHGGFALQLAKAGCTRVTAVDLSAQAIEKVRANAARAGLTNVDAQARDVFELLPELVKAGKRFDTVVLDPPAFASGKATETNALRAYNEVNLRAMKLVTPNGILVSCSCSGRITPEAFDAMLIAAARDAQRHIHFVERRAAGPDHPILGGVPETDYLKCRVLMVL